jgi:PhnB protein
MSTWLNPYLKFRDTAADALWPSTPTSSAGRQTPSPSARQELPTPRNASPSLMHGHLETPDGWTFMACDTADTDPREFDAPPVDLCIGGDTGEYDKIAGWFAGLSEGGTVVTPPREADVGRLVRPGT